MGWLPADGLLVTGTLFSVELARLWVDFLQCLLLTSSSWTPPCSTLLLYRSVLTTTASLLFCFQAGFLAELQTQLTCQGSTNCRAQELTICPPALLGGVQPENRTGEMLWWSEHSCKAAG